jgi:hypothetical protein
MPAISAIAPASQDPIERKTQGAVMFKEIKVQRVAMGTLFKLVGLGFVCTLVPFALLMGCFALFGASTVSWNQQPVTGVAGLIASPFIGLMLTAILTALSGSCMSLGLWLYSRFRPLTLLVKIEADTATP